MFSEPIKKQCCIRNSINNKEPDINNDCMTLLEKREILAGKKFSDYETYEVMVQASLFIPFLIIFVTQIFVGSIRSTEIIGFYSAMFYTALFVVFGYIINLIIMARNKKKYEINKIIMGLGSFLVLVLIALETDDINSNLIEKSLPWIILLSFFFIGIYIIVGKFEKFNCLDDEYTVKFISTIYLYYVFLIICAQFFFQVTDYTNLLIGILFIFLITVLFLHNQFLSLLKDNDGDIETFRLINGDISLENEQNYYESRRGY